MIRHKKLIDDIGHSLFRKNFVYKNKAYAVNDVGLLKCSKTGDWVLGVEYYCQELKMYFTRELYDFMRKFEPYSVEKHGPCTRKSKGS